MSCQDGKLMEMMKGEDEKWSTSSRQKVPNAPGSFQAAKLHGHTKQSLPFATKLSCYR